MASPVPPEPWFRGTAGAAAAPARLFYFPAAGASAASVLGWQAHLGTAVELQVALLPGRGPRLLEEPLCELDELVAHLAGAVAALAGPRLVFFGHSLGALVAFEVARALRRRGSPGPESLWVCGAEGPQTRTLTRQLHDLPQDELVEALREYQGTPAELLADAEMLELVLPGIRADFALSERYLYQPEPPLDLPIYLLRGDRDRYVEASRASGWGLETTWPLREHGYDGGHFLSPPNEASIAAAVVAELAAPPSNPPPSNPPLSNPQPSNPQPPNPYRSLPDRSFWRAAVADPAVEDIGDLWRPKFAVGPDVPILTAGSCFAQHIGRALLEAGLNWLDAEPAPPGLSAAERAARHYGEFSFRTGNIYTAAMLRQWLSWAFDPASAPAGVWAEGGRYLDPYRPATEPGGFGSAEAVRQAREQTLAAIRAAVARAGCLMFTLGLTEAWHDTDEGTVYPSCPGTVRGTFEPGRHVFRNATFAEVHRDLAEVVALARAAQPDLRVILTVSPVPLTATATGEHALVATTYSKSVLRAAAGQLAAELAHVDYFPSYELITGAPFGTRFFSPNLRTVSPEGVAFVMRHFLAAFGPQPGPQERPGPMAAGGDPYCDDAVLDYYRTR